MAKFKYVGDPNDKFSGPDTVEQYGQVFKKGGDAVELPERTDEEKKLIKKLQGNSHFIDLSDKDGVNDIAEQMKAVDAAEKAKEKAAEDQRKKDEAYAKELADNVAKEAQKRGPGRPRLTAATAPRPPGLVTRDPTPDPFQGRTAEERTIQEDHTRAGKTKG